MSSGADTVIKRRRTVPLPDGRRIEIEMLGLKDYEVIAEEATARYKKSIIRTYTENLEFVPKEQRDAILRQAFEKAEKINKDTLPQQVAWMPKEDKDGKHVLNMGDRFYHEDSGRWIETGDPILEQRKIDYTSWWMSFTVSGKAFAAWQSVRKCKGQEQTTLDDIEAIFLGDEQALEETANAIGELSQPRLGNSEPAAAKAGTNQAA